MSEMSDVKLAQRCEHLEASYRLWKRTGSGAVVAALILLGVTTLAFSQRDSEHSGPRAPQPARRLSVDTEAAPTYYANYVRVTGAPEELVLDFGLNTQMKEQPAEPIKASHRLVMNYYTAKRIVGALHQAVQQHENVYGELELDVSKRARKR